MRGQQVRKYALPWESRRRAGSRTPSAFEKREAKVLLGFEVKSVMPNSLNIGTKTLLSMTFFKANRWNHFTSRNLLTDVKLSRFHLKESAKIGALSVRWYETFNKIFGGNYLSAFSRTTQGQSPHKTQSNKCGFGGFFQNQDKGKRS